jgi:hypothetical protein
MKNMNFKNLTRFLSVTLGLLFIVCAANLSVIQAQVTYSGYARAAEGNRTTLRSAYMKLLFRTLGAR